MKLTYWVCPYLNDSETFSIRKETKREAEALRKSYGTTSYGPAQKVVMHYDSGFELAQVLLGEFNSQLKVTTTNDWTV